MSFVRECAVEHTGEIQVMKRRDIARIVSVLPQEDTNEFGFTVEELVAMGRLPHLGRFEREGPEDRRKINWAMEVTNTVHLRLRLSFLLAAVRCKVALAKALAQEPQALFLDEPTSHLDMNYQVEMLDVVKRLNRENKITVVAVMHDTNLAATYCDSMVLLSDGNGTVFASGNSTHRSTVENIRALYGLDVVGLKHPVNGKTLIFPAHCET